MKAHLILIGAAAVALALPATAQQRPTEPTPPAPVHVQVPQSGLTFHFQEIDRNGDNSISVEEWNAYVASLRARLGEAGGAASPTAASSPAGAAAAGGTAGSARPAR